MAARTTFYDAINWEEQNPGKKWDGDRLRARGKVSLLTYDMETELLHWVAVSQKHSGGVDMHSVCRVAFALMTSDQEHHKRVKEVHGPLTLPLPFTLLASCSSNPYPVPLGPCRISGREQVRVFAPMVPSLQDPLPRLPYKTHG